MRAWTGPGGGRKRKRVNVAGGVCTLQRTPKTRRRQRDVIYLQRQDLRVNGRPTTQLLPPSTSTSTSTVTHKRCRKSDKLRDGRVRDRVAQPTLHCLPPTVSRVDLNLPSIHAQSELILYSHISLSTSGPPRIDLDILDQPCHSPARIGGSRLWRSTFQILYGTADRALDPFSRR